MFTYKTTIKMHETDAAGRLYFAHQFHLFHEAYEAFFAAQGLPFGHLLRTKSYFVPIVHAEADYTAPLFVSDKISVRVKLANIGTTSFTMAYEIRDAKNKSVGSGLLIRVVVDKKTNKKIKLPPALRKVLSRLR